MVERVQGLTSEALEYYRMAGSITAKLRKYVRTVVSEGMSVIELCERVEAETFRLGGRPAFPCNVGINDVAAHYTSPIDDQTKIPAGSIVKVDFGVELMGYIADCAATICFRPEYESMVTASEEALRLAVNAVRPGLRLSEVGAIIERCIERYGLRPIRNLTGHKIERYMIHTGKSVPNVAVTSSSRFEVGEVFAIEPFVTLRTGAGTVRDSDVAHIYRLVREKGARTEAVRKLLGHLWENYRTLPFALRWLAGAFPSRRLRETLEEALKARCVTKYPVLFEASGSPVSQAEHTIIVTPGGCEVLTAD